MILGVMMECNMRAFIVIGLVVVYFASSTAPVNATDWSKKSADQSKNSFVNIPKPNCEPFTGEGGLKIGVVGDSQFTVNEGRCGSIDYFLSHALTAADVVNAAQSGGKFLSGGKKDITKQKLPFTPDLLIIGGGGNDLASCKGKSKCLRATLDKLIDESGNRGMVVETIKRLASPTTKVVIAQTSKVADFAPARWKKTAEAKESQEYVERLRSLAAKDAQIHFFDYSQILDTSSKQDWYKDGFHPSVSAYFRMSETISAKIRGDIDSFESGKFLQDVGELTETCSYVAIREGIDDKKDRFYRYNYGAGKIQFLDMKHKAKLRVKFLPEGGINNAETIQTDSFLTVDSSGAMSGWLGVYGGRKSKTTYPLYTTAEYSFEGDDHLYEGTHTFTSRDWKRKSFTKITVYDCGSKTSQAFAETITPQNLRDEWFQMDAIDVDGLLDVSKAEPIKLKLRLGIPDGDGPFPTVVILHGSGNMKERDKALGSILERHGIAWVGVYSYDSRGLKYRNWIERISNSNIFDQISDAYHVLDFIERHPLLDERKAAVTGFSLGGISSYAISSSSITQKFNVSNSKFIIGLNQYGPCIIFPEDPDPSLKVVHLWGQKDASTPKKLCSRLNEHFIAQGVFSEAQFVEGAAHGWFRQGPPSIDGDGNFQCEAKFSADRIQLVKGKKEPADMSDVGLMKFTAQNCGTRSPYQSFAHAPAEELAVQYLVENLLE